ncbi:tRNA (uridine(54)-C5)-methyltransferase TrmA [Carnimonas bestiolae]|uniref:tRNA (uridine(54)-C5)-methyltransferase TrmA n=1 Tax=Carnimonas bestiolae TaxID=3402172 RepID=UPI003EDC5E3C
MSVPVVDPSRYAEQLSAKQQRITQQFARFNPPPLEVFASPAAHYRMRAEFRIWHEGDDLFYAMFEVAADNPKDKTVIRLDQYDVASQRINELMPALRAAFLQSTALRRRLFQVEFLTTLAGEALVTLIYHRPLDDEWEREARALEQQLGIAIIGRSRKQRLVLTRDYVTERLHVDGTTFAYQQVENSFTQPNAAIAATMLSWSREVTQPEADTTQGDLVEFYCGNGHFSVALASNFRRVLGTEISRTSVASAQHNLALNAIDNAVIARMSAEEFSQALSGEHRGRRATALALDDYDFTTALVDPPRAGLDDDSCAQLARYSRIVYISCNPDTLERDIERLSATHEIARLALFDQFPYTHHCECGVLLVPRCD